LGFRRAQAQLAPTAARWQAARPRGARRRQRRSPVQARIVQARTVQARTERAGNRRHRRHVIRPAQGDGTPAVGRTQQETRSPGGDPAAPGEARERRPAGDQFRRVGTHRVPGFPGRPGELRGDLPEHGQGRRRGGNRRPIRHASKRHRTGRCPVQHRAPLPHVSLSAVWPDLTHRCGRAAAVASCRSVAFTRRAPRQPSGGRRPRRRCCRTRW
jgi:hypothetical protein